MNQIINSPTEIRNKSGWTVFLAGPMHSSPRGWRNRLVRTAEEMGMEEPADNTPIQKPQEYQDADYVPVDESTGEVQDQESFAESFFDQEG